MWTWRFPLSVARAGFAGCLALDVSYRGSNVESGVSLHKQGRATRVPGQIYCWSYNVLNAAEYFRQASLIDGVQPVSSMADAIKLIRAARQPDGTWLQAGRHPGRVWFEARRAGGTATSAPTTGSRCCAASRTGFLRSGRTCWPISFWTGSALTRRSGAPGATLRTRRPDRTRRSRCRLPRSPRRRGAPRPPGSP